MNYTVDSVLFNALCQEFELEFIQTCVTIFLYGVYIHLFVSMIGDLSRRTMDGRVPLLMAVWVMFVFGTAEALFAFARRLFLFRALQLQVQNPAHENDVLRFAQTVKTVKSLQKAQNILFAANNLLTDAFLLYR
ncbi:hypothetical protein FB45DRAFT_531005 [Roridomyces roridus]|nr:hypothetical protein FB45DRAFT_531005 [Roridomyces roridus]